MTHRCNEPEPGRLLTSWPSAGCRAITAWNSPNPTAPPTPSLFGPNPTLTRPPTPRGRVGRSGHHFFEQGRDEVSALLEKIEARRADLWRPSRRDGVAAKLHSLHHQEPRGVEVECHGGAGRVGRGEVRRLVDADRLLVPVEPDHQAGDRSQEALGEHAAQQRAVRLALVLDDPDVLGAHDDL